MPCKAAHLEYTRRGRPLRKAWWDIKMVASFMATHMEGKDENDDLGAHASWFSREYEDAPAPMPDFIMQQKEKKIEEHKEMPQKEAGYVTMLLSFQIKRQNNNFPARYMSVRKHISWLSMTVPRKVTPSLPDMHFVVDAIDDVYTALFPKHGYEIEVCAGGEINLHHPEIPEELAIMSEPRCFTFSFIRRND